MFEYFTQRKQTGLKQQYIKYLQAERDVMFREYEVLNDLNNFNFDTIKRELIFIKAQQMHHINLQLKKLDEKNISIRQLN
jgi:hypothetical protein